MPYKNILAFGVVMIVGVSVGYSLLSFRTVNNFDWQELFLYSSGIGYSYEVVVNSDLPLPEGNLSGKYKFISAVTNSRSDELNFGYKVFADIKELDLQKIPQKYKTERKVTHLAGEFTVPPIKEVVYSVTFDFGLKDRDGFELVQLKSIPHRLYSGRINEFQNVVKYPISLELADRVSKTFVSMRIEKCNTCDDY
ncbi:MAG: hypothetical protein KBF68_00335 [Nitrosomonas sp.]|jgi:hypothetical protein|nr:hypothetical protein [Nitrosomonas sp.]MBP9099830.1 hypothetical protein [Nitrosomonas sp.]